MGGLEKLRADKSKEKVFGKVSNCERELQRWMVEGEVYVRCRLIDRLARVAVSAAVEKVRAGVSVSVASVQDGIYALWGTHMRPAVSQTFARRYFSNGSSMLV